MKEDLDVDLMNFVRLLSVAIFLLIVAYFYVTSNEKDAKD